MYILDRSHSDNSNLIDSGIGIQHEIVLVIPIPKPSEKNNLAVATMMQLDRLENKRVAFGNVEDWATDRIKLY